jgi:hypothetical protein
MQEPDQHAGNSTNWLINQQTLPHGMSTHVAVAAAKLVPLPTDLPVGINTDSGCQNAKLLAQDMCFLV